MGVTRMEVKKTARNSDLKIKTFVLDIYFILCTILILNGIKYNYFPSSPVTTKTNSINLRKIYNYSDNIIIIVIFSLSTSRVKTGPDDTAHNYSFLRFIAVMVVTVKL